MTSAATHARAPRPRPRRARRTRTTLTGLALAAALVTAAACGDDDDGTSSSRLVETSLAHLPSIQCCDRQTVLVGDLDAASAALGLERPDPDDDAVGDWLMSLLSTRAEPMPSGLDSSDVMVPIGMPWASVSLSGDDRPFGRDLTEIGRFASLEPQAGPLFVAEIVADEPDDLADRLGPSDDGRWTVEGSGGTEQHVAERDDLFAISRHADLLDAWADEDHRTLADEEAFTTLARPLDDMDVYGAMLYVVGEPRPDEPAAPDAFTGIALGFALDDGVPVGAIVYSHPDEESAAANLEAVEQILDDHPRYASLLDDATVVRDADVVVLTFRPTEESDIGVGLQLWQRLDPLVARQPA